jgi:hypothetical protein
VRAFLGIYAASRESAALRRLVKCGATMAACFVALVATSSAVALSDGLPRGHVIARGFVHPNQGGYIRAHTGPSIFVPPGVMREPGSVTITSYGHGIFDIHIHALWRGTVAVSLPLGRRGDTIIHDVAVSGSPRAAGSANALSGLRSYRCSRTFSTKSRVSRANSAWCSTEASSSNASSRRAWAPLMPVSPNGSSRSFPGDARHTSSRMDC